jgi:hypothetical protein
VVEIKRFFTQNSLWLALGLVIVLTLSSLIPKVAVGQMPQISVPISLPQLAIVYKVNERTVSGKLTEVGADGVTVQRQGSDPVRVPLEEIEEEKGIEFDRRSAFYRCEDCEIVIRGEENTNPIGEIVEFVSQPLENLQVKDVETGQAQLLVENPNQFRIAVGKCKPSSGATCVADAVQIDPQTRAMTIRAIPY